MRRPTDRTLQLIGYGLLTVAAALGVGTIVLGLVNGDVAWVLQAGILVSAFVTTTALALRAQPGNGTVWALVGASFFGAASSFGSQIASARTGLGVDVIEDGTLPGSPADYDLISALGINVSLWAWIPSVFLLATLLLILFPDGSIPSRRWRAAAWIAGGSMVALSIQGMTLLVPWEESSYEALLAPGQGTTMQAPVGLLMLPLMAIALAAVIRIVARYRKTKGDERLQYRWVGWALGLYVVVGIFFFAALQSLGDVGGVLSNLLLANIPISIGVAITKYRLYDIDLVISRTFVYGSLAIFIGAVYVAIVVGIGTVFGAGDEPNAGLAIAATAVVAVAFQPLRRRLEKVANRLVYGRRATPYEVLSEFSRRVAATDDTLLSEAARSLVDGTGAEHSAVWVNVGDHLVKATEWPAFNGDTPVEQHSFPIVQDGAELGVLTLGTPRGQRLPAEDRRLAAEVASGMGLALRNQLLTESLQARVGELRDSRRRLVAVQDETRRKLERDLHDGAQQQLVALKVKLGLARAIAEKSGASETAAMIEQLTTEADGAVDAMREFARGVYPPLLEAEGLGSAIAAQARRAPLPVTVESDGIGRYSRDVEATVYFCVLEALQNTTKHANATRAVVSLSQTNGSVGFTVTDDGEGYVAGDTPSGAGLTNMEDRLDAAGGTLGIEASPGRGVTITGTLPIAAEVTT